MSQQRTQGPRQYGAEEVQEILRRTSGLERKKQLERPTLELAEIEAIARESGLDPTLVRRAAEELEQKRDEKGLATRLAGAPLRQVREREVDGELTTAMHEGLAQEIRATLGPQAMMGQISAVGRTLTWTAFSKSGAAELNIFPREGKTVIRIEVNSSQVAGGIFGGIIGGVGGGLGANLLWMLPVTAHLPWFSGPAAFGATLVGAWGLARAIYTATISRLNGRLETVMDKLEKQVRDTVAPPR